MLNHTYTAMAARLLRVNLLAPITGMFLLDFLPSLGLSRTPQFNQQLTRGSTSSKVDMS